MDEKYDQARARALKRITDFAEVHHDRGITMKELQVDVGVDYYLTQTVIQDLWMSREVLRIEIPMGQRNNPRRAYGYVPNSGYWAARAAEDVPMHFDAPKPRQAKIWVNAITAEECRAAKAKVRPGDVLPAIAYAPQDTCDTLAPVTRQVVVAAKSRHLILCTDGSTYNYATLAMHYRNRKVPLGKWER